MIVTAIAIFTNYDKVIQAQLLDTFSSYSTFLNHFEGNKAVKNQLAILKGKNDTPDMLNKPLDLSSLGRAPEFSGISKWLNTDKPFSTQGLRGKVVLVDFWTYTCINCIRTLPHVTSWYEKYKDKGFVVVGVHTPEFEFEKKTENVEQAIKQFGIHYPVAQDNKYETWNAFANHYWPAEYLIDAKGVIRRTHFGEGEYEETEEAIKILLKEIGSTVDATKIDMPDQTPKMHISPETYLGSTRMAYLFPNGSAENGIQNFTLGNNIPDDTFSFGGIWDITNEQAIAKRDAVLEFNFYAQRVFLVLRPGSAGKGSIKVYLDGQLVDVSNSGDDVRDGMLTVDTDRLYNLVKLSSNNRHVLKLEFQTSGIEAYAFTFG